MNKHYCISLHDVRVSEPTITIERIEWVRKKCNCPITVHLIFDAPLKAHEVLTNYLIEKTTTQEIEVVFHGLSHACPPETYSWLAFYHKQQAEYLLNSTTLQSNTQTMFERVKNSLNTNLGICPPCWLSTKENVQLFKSLNPIYIEKLLSIETQTKNFFSPVISLGSPNKRELVWLRLLALLITRITILCRFKTVRLAIHTCDLPINDSMKLFEKTIHHLEGNNYKPILMNKLILNSPDTSGSQFLIPNS